MHNWQLLKNGSSQSSYTDVFTLKVSALNGTRQMALTDNSDL
jgi:hypothetical protein